MFGVRGAYCVCALALCWLALSVPAVAQTATSSAARHHSHKYDSKFTQCKKQADVHQLHFAARRAFMETCLAK